MSELCNAFTFWMQPKSLYSHGFSQIHIQTSSILHHEDVDKYIWQYGKQPNCQTINYNTWLALLSTASIVLPAFTSCCQNRSISMDFWKYVSAQLFVAGFCVLLFVPRLPRVGEERKKERDRVDERLLLPPHLKDSVWTLDTDPGAVTYVHKYSNKGAGVGWTKGQCGGGIFVRETQAETCHYNVILNIKSSISSFVQTGLDSLWTRELSSIIRILDNKPTRQCF